MKKLIVPSIILGSALALGAAEPKETVKNALKALGEKANYSWTTTTETQGAQRQPNPVKGMTEKGGCTFLCQELNTGTAEAVIKGEQRIVKTEEGWKSAAELRAAGTGQGGGGGARGAMMGRALLNMRTPVALAEDLLDKLKECKAGEGGIITADLTEEGARELLTFGRRERPGQESQNAPPGPKNARGSIKFWIKDGLVAKIELKLQGTVTGRDQQERDVARTVTHEIKDVGTTKVAIPEDAKKKLAS
jgi:hypothetical protein